MVLAHGSSLINCSIQTNDGGDGKSEVKFKVCPKCVGLNENMRQVCNSVVFKNRMMKKK